MAPKDQADQTERRSPLLLPNKISDAAPAITKKIRDLIEKEIQHVRSENWMEKSHFLMQSSLMTSILPAHWESFPSDFKMFLEKEMFDPIIKHVLETEKLINWCPSVQKLYPLITPGDGNCLLHAVSLGMWCVDDSELVLRKALYYILKEDRNDRNHLRWKRERMRVDASIPDSGLRYDTTEWEREWEMVKAIASPEQRPPEMQGLLYESLEQYHVFMLANLLKRPIIVLASDMMRSQFGHSLQPQHLHGIYLPLNWDSSRCCRHPILLGFYSNHFVPLLSTAKLDAEEEGLDHLIPIMQQNGTQMRVHFLLEEEEEQVETLLQKYLIIEDVVFMGESLSTTRSILGAQLACRSNHQESDLLVAYLQLAETHYRAYLETEYGSNAMGASLEAQSTFLSKNREMAPQFVLEKSNSFPSVSGSSLVTTSKHSWSGFGAPASQMMEPPFSNTPVMSSLVNQSCKTEGCIYYRSVSTGDYCHECFQKQNQNGKCAGDRCLNPPEQGCQGLCRVCFDQRKLMEVPAARVSSPSLVPRNPDVSSSQAGINQSQDDILKTKPLEKEPWKHSHQVASSSSGSRVNPSGQEPHIELNSILVHQKLPTRKCIIPECPLTGDPTKNDMCNRCYAENMQVARELRKASQVKEEDPEPISDIEQSVAGATAYGNGVVAGARPKVIAEASATDPNPTQKKKGSRPTVKKNICARAGCDGVRLIHPSYQGYCINCHKRNMSETQAVPVQDLASAGRKRIDPEGWIDQPKSNPKLFPVEDIKGSLAMKSTAQGKAGNAKKIEAVYGQGSSAATASTAAASSTAGVASTDKTCMHPRCNNLAAPPKFILCEECIQISEMFHEKGTVESSSRQTITTESETTLAGPKDATKPDEESVSRKAELKKLADSFKNVQITRVKCKVPGGCVDDMFGDPELDNLCSRCFAKMTLKRSRNRSSPTPTRMEVRPLPQPAVNHYNTAPIKPSPRVVALKPSSQTEVIYINHEGGQRAGSSSRRQNPLPSNYRACASPGCINQANLQILEGFCNDCHQVYRNQRHLIPPENGLPGSDTQALNKGHFAQSSQSTVPEAWISPSAVRDEKILNIEGSRKAPPLALSNRTDMRCLSIDCLNYGNPRCQGYCNSCFRLVKN